MDRTPPFADRQTISSSLKRCGHAFLAITVETIDTDHARRFAVRVSIAIERLRAFTCITGVRQKWYERELKNADKSPATKQKMARAM